MCEIIKQLTEAQDALMPTACRDWTRIGLATSQRPVELSRVRECIARIYRNADLEPPGLVVQVGSPLAVSTAATQLAQTGVRIGDQVRHQVMTQVRDRLGLQIRAQISSRVEARIRERVWARVRGPVGDQVRDRVWDQVRVQAADQRTDWSWGMLAGNLEASWLSYHDFTGKTLGLDCCRRLEAHGDLALAGVGFWLPATRAAIVSPTPSQMHRDDHGELHCDDGPAITYPDGWSVWAHHGVVVPRDVIESPAQITVDRIRAEHNSNIRRVMRERYGEGRYLVETGAKVIDIDTVATDAQSPNGQRIHRALLEDDEGGRFLVGTDGSTNKAYYMPVPVDCRTCEQAHNALSGLWDSDCIMQG